jgi:ubiquinone/menaquinone biosynthesis C-methylase UbiE
MSIIRDQSTYWNNVASQKAFGHPIDWGKWQELVARDARVLDYGCGHGRLCGELANKGFRNVIGVDSSVRMIEIARNTYPNRDFRVVENSGFPFDDEVFDVVLLFTVLTSVPANEEQMAVVTESHRVLRQGGILYVSDMPLQNDKRNRDRYEKFARKYGVYGVFELSDGGVMRHHDMTWIHSLLRQSQQLSLSEIDVTTMNGNRARAFQYIGRKA